MDYKKSYLIISIILILLLLSSKIYILKKVDYLEDLCYSLLSLIVFTIIVILTIYYYSKYKQNIIIYYFLFIIAIFIFLFYNIGDYFSTIYVTSKFFKMDIKNKNFYDTFNTECKKIIKINRINSEIVDDYKIPTIYIANHYRENSLALIMSGALLEKKLKIFIIGNKFLRNAVYDEMGCIFIDNFKCKKVGKEGKYIEIKKLFESQINAGFSILCFPEGNNLKIKNSKTNMDFFRSGIFRISKELNTNIVPIAINWKKNNRFLVLSKQQKEITIIYGEKLDLDKSIEDIVSEGENKVYTLLNKINYSINN